MQEQILSAFSAHDLLLAYIPYYVAADVHSENLDANEAAKDMLYHVDEAVKNEIRRYLADLTDEDFKNELDR